eukprot:6185851-Pleurochrysis_carterae.AAC.1
MRTCARSVSVSPHRRDAQRHWSVSSAYLSTLSQRVSRPARDGCVRRRKRKSGTGRQGEREGERASERARGRGKGRMGGR